MKSVLAFSVMVIALAGVASAVADDTQVTPDELFKKLDSNGDGKLTASEIPAEHRKFFERLLRLGDADKNGELTREEFDHAFRQTEQPVTDINKVGGLGAGAQGPGKVDAKRLFQSLDKNKDGKLTRDELEGRPRLLALFDRLGKEELTLEDVTAALGGKPNGKKAKKRALAAAESTAKDSQEMPGADAAHSLPAFFQLLDTNHDGRLSEEELAKAGELFQKLDRNHDGFIDAKEFQAAGSVAGKDEEGDAPAIRPGNRFAKFHNGNRIAQMIKRADTDGDGKISMEEAPPQLKKHFAKIDTNGDGFLDRSEIEAWIKHHQKRLNASNDTPNSETPNSDAPAETKKPSGL
jgi:Ca2+-binding EF-hand superfamily protein